jgi:hypothetical protein
MARSMVLACMPLPREFIGFDPRGASQGRRMFAGLPSRCTS